MGGPIDGIDYIMFVFVYRNELQSYKKRWPNQILVELPFDNEGPHWRDLSRTTIKVFGETLGSEYVFMVEDNIYCAYKANEGKFEPATLLEYFQALQKGAESNAPLVGSRVVGLGQVNEQVKDHEWENGLVQSAFLIRTDLDVPFPKGTGGDVDDSLFQFNRACNNAGVVQQNQTFILQCGYTITDPITGNEYRDKEPGFININEIEPDCLHGNNLKVKVLSNEVAIDKKLSDGSRFARSCVVIADETACIALIAKNEQIEQLEVGKSYYIRNSYLTMYEGFMRVELDEWGKIEEYDSDISPKAKPKCMSLVEYELVNPDGNDRNERNERGRGRGKGKNNKKEEDEE
jgi:hypothetical protein